MSNACFLLCRYIYSPFACFCFLSSCRCCFSYCCYIQIVVAIIFIQSITSYFTHSKFFVVVIFYTIYEANVNIIEMLLRAKLHPSFIVRNFLIFIHKNFVRRHSFAFILKILKYYWWCYHSHRLLPLRYRLIKRLGDWESAKEKRRVSLCSTTCFLICWIKIYRNSLYI